MKVKHIEMKILSFLEEMDPNGDIFIWKTWLRFIPSRNFKQNEKMLMLGKGFDFILESGAFMIEMKNDHQKEDLCNDCERQICPMMSNEPCRRLI